MSIIFNERRYAKEVERKEIKKQYGAVRDGTLLAKLYLERGLSEPEIINLLCDKFTIYDGTSIPNLKLDNVRKMLNQAKASPELKEVSIRFSYRELDFIHNIKDITIEKAFFIMLCIYKFYGGRFYVKEKEVFDLAKISWGGKSFQRVFGYLVKNKYFTAEERPLPNNKNLREIFYCPTEEVQNLYNPDEDVLNIEDFKNLVYYYLMYFDVGHYFFCSNCGCIEERRSNSQKYCKECAELIHKSSKNEKTASRDV